MDRLNKSVPVQYAKGCGRLAAVRPENGRQVAAHGSSPGADIGLAECLTCSMAQEPFKKLQNGGVVENLRVYDATAAPWGGDDQGHSIAKTDWTFPGTFSGLPLQVLR